MTLSLPKARIYGGGTAPSRLSVSGPYFVDPSGALVIRRSLTAFCLPKRYATGRADEANAYLDWAAAMGFNEVRVFTQVDWTGPPGKGVEGGWGYSPHACEQLLYEARSRGLRVELVAHTFAYDVEDMANHLAWVDSLCGKHDNALLEIANEPHVNGIDVLAVLGRYTPRTAPWASGVYEPSPYPAGPCLTWHSPRNNEWSRKPKGAIEYYDGSGPDAPFTPPYHGPIMLDEPPQVEQTIRDAASYGWTDVADDWQSYAALCAFFGAGGLLHGNPQFQQCIIPTDPTVLACVKAFHAGFDAVKVQRYSGYSGSLQPPPSSNPGSRRYRRTGEDGRTYEITCRPFSFKAV